MTGGLVGKKKFDINREDAQRLVNSLEAKIKNLSFIKKSKVFM